MSQSDFAHRDSGSRVVADELAGEAEALLVLGARLAEQEVGEVGGEEAPVCRDGGAAAAAAPAAVGEGLSPVADVLVAGQVGLELAPPGVHACDQRVGDTSSCPVAYLLSKPSQFPARVTFFSECQD